MLLTILTLGLYYPWARVAILKYKYANTDFLESRFSFQGNPKEIFKGFMILWVLGLFYFGSQYFVSDPAYALITKGVAGLIIFCLFPWMTVSSYRYRLSRTMWRGLTFAYAGTVKSMYLILAKWMLILFVIMGLLALATVVPAIMVVLAVFIIIGVPILYAAFQVSIYKELVGNIKYGNVSFEFRGDPVELFKFRLFGLLGAFFTLGLSLFWMVKKEHEFKLDNTLIFQNGEPVGRLELYYKFWDFVGFYILNFLIIVFTLGIATPWVVLRNTNFYFKYLNINANFDLESIEQFKSDSENAIGDTFADSLTLDFGVY
jgi:uncharacterized membrane protein YjgN (DUF898 family)